MTHNNYLKCFAIACTAMTIACSNIDKDYIPGPIMPPEGSEQPTPPAPGDYNNLGIEIHKDGEPYNSYQGLVMCGYQGWFACPGDGSQYSQVQAWPHYADKWSFPRIFQPGVGRNGIDFWPDTREYEITYEADTFELPDGTHPRLFSSYDESSVRTHFRWMQEYGIDGVFMQRFASQIGNSVAIE